MKKSTKKINVKNAIGKLDSVSKYIPTADLVSTFNNLLDVYKQDNIIKKDIASIEAKKELLIKEMTMKYDLYHKVFDKVFDERGLAIEKSFDIIDKGLEENDKDKISMGLKSLSTVVASSPFGNLSELSGLLEGPGIIEIWYKVINHYYKKTLE